jgi:hypothetical protein
MYANVQRQSEAIPKVAMLKLNELQRAAAAVVIVAELDFVEKKYMPPVHMLLHGLAVSGAASARRATAPRLVSLPRAAAPRRRVTRSPFCKP